MNLKSILTALMLSLAVVGCSPSREVIQIVKGDKGDKGDPGVNGTSCSVAPELDSESFTILGARISCTDGSFSVVLNGRDGIQGIQGPQGGQGIQGPAGQNGRNAQACQAYRSNLFRGVFLDCPGQLPVLISDGRDGRDGEDGRDGRDGTSCSSTRQASQSRVKITCGSAVTYVYDGENGTNGTNGVNGTNGTNGTSCTVRSASGGANVTCGSSTVFIANGAVGPQGTPGAQGATGAAGQPGRDGLNGTNGEDAVRPGLSCNVHDLRDWNGIGKIENALLSSAPAGNFVLANLNVGDSPSANGFPGMPSALQAAVGLEGYALDCNGYLNIETSGVYDFSMLSDDGVKMAIDGQTIVNDPSLHSPSTSTKKNVDLYRGPRAINVIYYQGPHSQIALQLKYSGPFTPEQVIPASRFTH